MAIQSNTAGSRVDNALRAIEFALQELISMGASQSEVTARWSTHSDDTAHAAAVTSSMSRRGAKA